MAWISAVLAEWRSASGCRWRAAKSPVRPGFQVRC